MTCSYFTVSSKDSNAISHFEITLICIVLKLSLKLAHFNQTFPLQLEMVENNYNSCYLAAKNLF